MRSVAQYLRTTAKVCLVVLLTLVVVAIGWNWYLAERGKEAIGEIWTFSRKHNGDIIHTLRRGNYLISVHGSDFGDADLKTLASLMRQLRPQALDHSGEVYLNLSGTRVTDQGLTELVGVNLMGLDVSDTGITNAGVRSLSAFRLHSLNVSRTRITDDAIEVISQFR